MRVQGNNRNLHIGMALPGSPYTLSLWSSVEGGEVGWKKSVVVFLGREFPATIQMSDIGEIAFGEVEVEGSGPEKEVGGRV